MLLRVTFVAMYAWEATSFFAGLAKLAPVLTTKQLCEVFV